MKICILGAGSWGTALAKIFSQRASLQTVLWSRSVSQLEKIKQDGENKKYLPGIKLENIEYEPELDRAMEADIILLAVPMAGLRVLCKSLAKSTQGKIFVLLSKGLESFSFKLPHQIAAEMFPSETNLVILSGPSHAEEAARNMPTAVTIASKDHRLAKTVQGILTSPTFRIYTNEDIVGVEIGGAIKNVIALAAGISLGLGFGANTLSALMTRGLVEMNRLGSYFGARPETLYGLSGLGDMIATCMSPYSRNRQVGESIGKGKKWEEIEASMDMVAEGVPTVRAVYQLATEKALECPISEAVYQVIFENKSTRKAVMELMGRETKSE